MKKSRRRIDPYLKAGDWHRLARAGFPELDLPEDDAGDTIHGCSACEALASLADEAHATGGDRVLLHRCYEFIRWSIRNTDDAELKGRIAHSFFDTLLSLPHSKTGCLDYLDWGDVELLIEGFEIEPAFEDVENFLRLCAEWKRRWARNQKLKAPQWPVPAETMQPSGAPLTDPRGFLEAFALRHVVPEFRQRFVHEAMQKPGKLHGRICHRIHEVFPDHCRGGAPPFQPDDECIPITGSGLEPLKSYTWQEVERRALRGLGLLVVSADGTEFYAETEAEYGQPSISYSS